RHRHDRMVENAADRTRRTRWAHHRPGRARARRNRAHGGPSGMGPAGRDHRTSRGLPVPHLVRPRRVDAAARCREAPAAAGGAKLTEEASRGDVEPALRIALGLIADGHETTIVAHADCEHSVTALGCSFVPFTMPLEPPA